MKTRLKIKPQTTWLDLDLYEDIPISANIQQDDLAELGSSSSKYTKTFVIPGTKENNKVFGNFFQVSGINFNPLLKVECVVEDGGNIIFDGFLRLNAVIINDEFIDYEVYILTAISDFSSEIQGLTLKDLSYQDINHEMTYSAITTSWEYTGGTSGLFNGQIIYPMINYGLLYQGSTPSFDFTMTGSNSITQSAYAIPEFYFKPSIQLKSLVDRIFSATSYNYQSNFFNSDYFKSIYMTLSNNGEIGLTTEEETENRNKFKVYADRTLYYYYDQNDKRKPIPFSKLTPDGYDPLGSYTLDDDMPGFSNDDYRNYFNVPISGDYYFNLRFRYTNGTGVNYPAYFRIKVYKSTNPNQIDGQTLVYQTPGSGYAALGSVQDANVFFSGSMLSNEYMSVYMEFIDTAGFPDQNVRLYGYQAQNTVSMDLYTAPNVISNQDVNMKLQVPEIGVEDFMKALFGMFNLVVEKDDVDKLLTIEPWNVYYNETDRAEKDWTHKLNLQQSYRIEPLDFTLSRSIKWTYEPGSDENLNYFWENEFKTTFGEKVFTSTSNILTGQQLIELPFAPTPTEVIDGSSRVIIPQTFQYDDNGLKQPAMDTPHLMFWCGNQYFYSGSSLGQASYWLQSGTTQVEWTTYPQFSHLSNVGLLNSTQISDLNFQPTWDYWGTTNQSFNLYSSYSLYRTFWEDYITSIYSTEARRLKGKFLLKPEDIGDLKLNDKIFLKDNFWRIEKVTDANLVKEDFVEVSLLKELSGFYDRQPPSPIYSITPNKSYPPTTPNNLYWSTVNDLAGYSNNIRDFNAYARQESSGTYIFATQFFASGIGSFYSGNLQCYAGFTYRNISGSINNLELKMGSAPGSSNYGILQIPQPSDNAYYELDITRYFPASGNLYITIDTY